MLKQYIITLKYNSKILKNDTLSYFLYASLLSYVDRSDGDLLHQDGYTPITGYVTFDEENDNIIWHVTLFGIAIEWFEDILSANKFYKIKKYDVILKVINIDIGETYTAQQFFNYAIEENCRNITLVFDSATSFKSKGKYQNIPSLTLILNSLVNKWNTCFKDFIIEDEDNSGIDTIIAGLTCIDYNIYQENFKLKGNYISGFSGYMKIRLDLKGFHLDLAKALLFFSQYSGVGIKTTLGMGGVSVMF